MHKFTSLSPFWVLANGKFEFNNDVWDVGTLRHVALTFARNLIFLEVTLSHVISFSFLSQHWIATL